MARLPKLPSLLDRKIYKTGQTRGADDDQIFQNRVGRNSTVLIPFAVWVQIPAIRALPYENGFIVLVPPRDYFETEGQDLTGHGLEIGVNALVYFERRDEWLQFNPDQYGFTPPTSRKAPLGGHFAARIANTTSENDARINIGFTSTGLKGAGIRLYEYADTATLGTTRIQLEAAFWHAVDAEEKMLTAGMSEDENSSPQNGCARECDPIGPPRLCTTRGNSHSEQRAGTGLPTLPGTDQCRRLLEPFAAGVRS